MERERKLTGQDEERIAERVAAAVSEIKELDEHKEATAHRAVTGNSDIWEEIGQETQQHMSVADDRYD